ncbi:MAG: hypothetical protein RL391_696 [Actinomycetota bacterium]|jgi:uncharacterized protein (DUF305 family)
MTDDGISARPTDAMADPEFDDVDIVLPWWQNPLNFIALGLAALILGVGLGYYIGDKNASPSYNQVDVGFLQDMRYHHEQAVDMAYFYLTSGDETHPRLRLFAEEILYSQQMEVGRMIQMLRQFHESEANDTGTAMSWMGMPVPIDDMNGLATPEQLDAFAAAEGADASVLFAQLMIAHHRGGIHMADYALENGRNQEVKDLARSMIAGQQPEIDAMTAVLEELEAIS